MLTKEHKVKIKYLDQYKYLNKDIDRKIKSLEDWRSKIYNVTGTISDMPRSGNRSNIIENGIASIDEIEETITNDLNELIELREEIEGKIENVDDLKLKEILKSRYLDFKTWEEIAYRNHCSWRHVYRMHENALDKITI